MRNTTVNATYEGIPLGLGVRKQLGHTYIYRIRTGNGYYFSVEGVKYQDKYNYIVPTSIRNPEGQPARDAMAQAVDNWQNMTGEEVAYWNTEARCSGKYTSGYTCYIGRYIQEHA